MIDLTNFKPIPGFENYLINKDGEVYSKPTKKIRKINKELFKKYNSYYSLGLRNKGREFKLRIHRLVALTYIPNPENKLTVNHKDGNIYNNNVDNLEWSTQQEQSEHVIENNLKKKIPTGSEIVRIFPDGNTKYYENVMEASRLENINQPNITRWLNKTRNASDGSKWLYKTDYELSLTDGKEEWKNIEIDGNKTDYFISNYGRFRKNNIVKKGFLKNGYHKYSITVNDVKKSYLTHRLVCFAFLGNPPTENMTVDHINRIKNDNRLSNLRWTTSIEQAENMKKTEKGSGSKSVIMYDKSGKELNRFFSASEAYEFIYGKSGCGRSISKVCRNEREFAYGYRWSYKETENNYEERKVNQINYNQPIIKILNSIETRYLNLDDACIKENIKDKGVIRCYIRKIRAKPKDGSEWFLEFDYIKSK